MLGSSVLEKEWEGLNCPGDGLIMLDRKGKSRHSREEHRQEHKCEKVQDPGSVTNPGMPGR